MSSVTPLIIVFYIKGKHKSLFARTSEMVPASQTLLLFPLEKARAGLPEFGFTPKLLQTEAIPGCGWRKEVPGSPPRASASLFPLQPEKDDLGERALSALCEGVSTASTHHREVQRWMRGDGRNQSYAGIPARDWMKEIGAAGSSKVEPTEGLPSLINACRDTAKHGQWCGRGMRVFLRVPDRGLVLPHKYLVMQSSKQMPACIQCPATSGESVSIHHLLRCNWRMKGCSWWRRLDQLGATYFALVLSQKALGWERRKGPRKFRLYVFCVDPCVQGSSPIYPGLWFLWEEKHLVLR